MMRPHDPAKVVPSIAKGVFLIMIVQSAMLENINTMVYVWMML